MIASGIHVEGGKGVLVGGVYNKHRKQPCRFSVDRILGKDVMGTRIFLPGLARAINMWGLTSTWLRIDPEIT
jgi:hypothetical protein